MNKISLFGHLGIALAGSLLAFSSCSMEEEIGGSFPEGEYPMEFTTSVKELKVTRSATVDGVWQSGDQIAVRVDGDQGVKTYTPTTGISGNLATLTSTAPFYWQKSDETKKVSAWYYGDNVFRGVLLDSWSVESDQNTGDGYQESDFLYAPETAITFNGRTTSKLAFYHQTARVVINIENAEAVTDAADIQSVIVGDADNLALSGTYTQPSAPNTAGLWDISSAASGTVTPKEIPPTGSYLKSYAALLIPQNMSEKTNKKFIAVTLTSGDTYYYTPENQAADLASGQQYTYNITVKHGYLVVEAEDSGEWQDGGSSAIMGKVPFRTFTADELKPGDYFYRKDDGTWATSDGGLRALYPEGYCNDYVDDYSNQVAYGSVIEAVSPDPTKGTCIGIVVKVGIDKDGDFIDDCVYMQKDGATSLNNIKGYVMALNEAQKLQWTSENKQAVLGVTSRGSRGYSNTQAMKKYAKEKGKDLQTFFPALYYAAESYESQCAAPDNTSGWFLPASGQYDYFTKVNMALLLSLQKATGDSGFSWLNPAGGVKYYWSSTENTGGNSAASMGSIIGGVGATKISKCFVRAWLTF
nr:fimbrillin family protein [Parabacteroides goldsteinii]